jgi:hypothetical protein
MKRFVLLAALMTLTVPCRATAAEGVRFFGRTVTPLLYVVSAESADFGATWNKRQIYIFRDGTVLSASLGERHDSELPLGGAVSSGTASQARMRELATALADAKVGHQTDCSIDPPDSPLEWYFSFVWFGSGDRKNSFEATQDPGPRCPPEIESLISAVQLAVNSARQSATTQLSVP